MKLIKKTRIYNNNAGAILYIPKEFLIFSGFDLKGLYILESNKNNLVLRTPKTAEEKQFLGDEIEKKKSN